EGVSSVRIGKRHVGGGNHPYLLAHMVKSEHFVEEQEAGVWNAEFILCAIGQSFDLTDGIVGEEPNRARGKGRQSGDPGGLVAPESVSQHVKYVAFDASGPAAFCDVDLPAASNDALVGIDSDEGVASDLLASFNGLQQEAFVLLPGRAQKS